MFFAVCVFFLAPDFFYFGSPSVAGRNIQYLGAFPETDLIIFSIYIFAGLQGSYQGENEKQLFFLGGKKTFMFPWVVWEFSKGIYIPRWIYIELIQSTTWLIGCFGAQWFGFLGFPAKGIGIPKPPGSQVAQLKNAP